MQRKACEDILDQEYETMPSAADKLGYLRVNLLRRRIDRVENTSLKKKNPQDDSRGEEKSADSVKNADVSNGIIAGNADASNKNITKITKNKYDLTSMYSGKRTIFIKSEMFDKKHFTFANSYVKITNCVIYFHILALCNRQRALKTIRR